MGKEKKKDPAGTAFTAPLLLKVKGIVFCSSSQKDKKQNKTKKKNQKEHLKGSLWQ